MLPKLSQKKWVKQVLEIRNLVKTYRERGTAVQAIQGIDLSVEQGEFLILLGSSGCGKTTTLRAIAGLELPDDGEIRIDGAVAFSKLHKIAIPPEQRPIAMVFQSYAIWPHLNVFENVAFPLRYGVRRVKKELIYDRVMAVLKVLGLELLAERQITTLSGGQQQRVALARAIALQPKVLLMDEPLSNLDFKLRARLRIELKELMKRLKLTTIYVTHDQTEALEMGDRIAVMNHGRIEQLAVPRAIYESPCTEFVARFIGEMNFIDGVVKEIKPNKIILDTLVGQMSTRYPSSGIPVVREKWLLGIRPEDIQIRLDLATGLGNLIKGTVESSQYLGEVSVYRVAVGKTTLQIKCHHSLVAAGGESIALHLPEQYCIVVKPENQDN